MTMTDSGCKVWRSSVVCCF